MDPIIYSQDDSLDRNTRKPPAYDHLIPYSSLDPRNFEVLIFLLYKNEIVQGEWVGRYSDISLMQGIRDKGRDCCLINDGTNAGLIQCKNYEKPLAKDECAKEIIKFVIHSAADPSLIGNRTTYDYYFAAAGGFKDEATDLLNQFKSKILSEPKLDKWIDVVFKANAAFERFDFNGLLPTIHRILGSLDVHLIIGEQIDALLYKPENANILRKFFEVQLVVPLDDVRGIAGEIKDHIDKTLSSSIPEADLRRELDAASHYLFDYNNCFSTPGNLHLERQVTKEILTWIKEPLEEKEKYNNVTLLSANAGMGKSVVMKDLCTLLRQQNIPVLGIKADRYAVENIEALQKKLNLQNPPHRIIKKLAETHSLVVICIDQLDALSQSLSSKRDYMETFDSLINSLRFLKNVRIVISTRTYDLQYDTSLQYYKDQKTFSVELLTIDELKSILDKTGVSFDSLQPALQQLIRTPNELNVFLKIYNPSLITGQLNTLYDLYNELWRQKVVTDEIKSVLYRAASKMYELQIITLSELVFSDNPSALEKCRSENLIVVNDGSVQFFHQTFYDYVFARHFAESSKSVEKYIVENRNSLYIRSCVKMILSFLSLTEPKKFTETITRIVTSRKFRFHLKVMSIQHFAAIKHPSAFDKKFLKTVSLKNRFFFEIFIESVLSSEWLAYLITNGYIDEYLVNQKTKSRWSAMLTFWKQKTEENSALRNTSEEKQHLIRTLLTRHLQDDKEIIIQFLSTLPEFDHKPDFIFWVLSSVRNFDTKNGCDLIDKYRSELKKDSYACIEIIERAIPFFTQWAALLFLEFLTEDIQATKDAEPDTNGRHQFRYEIPRIYKKLMALDPELAFSTGISIVEKTVQVHSYKRFNEGYQFFRDAVFDDMNLRDKDQDGYRKIYQSLSKLVVILAESHPHTFLSFFNEYKNSSDVSMLRLIFTGLSANGERMTREIREFVTILMAKNAFDVSDTMIEYELKELLKVSYPFFSQDMQEKINEKILSLTSKFELGTIPENGKKKFTGGYWFGGHQYAFLNAIPQESLQKYPALVRKFQEWQRKFPDFVPRTFPRRGVLSGMSATIPAKAYDHFTLEKWVEILVQFTKNLNTDEAPKTDASLSRQLSEYVKKDPVKFYPLLEKIAGMESIAPEYVIWGIEALREKGYEPTAFAVVYKKLLLRVKHDFDVLRLLWVSGYLINHQLIDEDIFQFLKEQALNSKNPATEKDASYQRGTNTVRGAAIYKLIYLYNEKQWQDQLMDIAEKVADDPIACVRSSLLVHLAYMIYIDKERTLRIFTKIVTNDPHILEAAGWSAQYISFHNFKALRNYFIWVLDTEGETMKFGVAALVHRWAQGFEGSDELLEMAVQKGEKVCAYILHVACYNLINEDGTLDQKSAELFLRFLNDTSAEISSQYSFCFAHCKPKDFKALRPLIQQFAASQHCHQGVHNYFEFLFGCVKYHPIECIDLILAVRDIDKLDRRIRIEKDNPVKVLIGAYNRLYSDSPTHPYLDKALNVFELLLKKTDYRIGMATVLENVEE